MKRFCLLTTLVISLSFSTHAQDTIAPAYLLPAQHDTAKSIIPDPYIFVDRYSVSESRDDSLLIWEMFSDYSHFYELESIVEQYLSFDDNTIHYSPRFDPLKKKDTTLIYLLDSGEYVHPSPGHITSRFGPRRRKYHYGTDIKLYTGDTVRSAFDGVVRISRYNRSYGYLIIVRHYNGLETYYAHLSKLIAVPDQKVKAGDVLGLGGNTGRSSGAHLHWEIRYLGTPINPEKIVDIANGKLFSDTLYLCRALFSYIKGSGSDGTTRYHKVKNGETLSSIARRYGTSVSNLQRLNRMSRSTTIRVGSSLRVR
ncbi:MAG: peptidoglycan DD-metalloendopeptidase family protein [Bacteroidales bacterium]|jgi:murein DD-endopeptidase MepM/ murein hydrolase activator NlpD|nr:peptidoglycan DD-metalloendopeptidase family protein [Bacteroidales bacterium]